MAYPPLKTEMRGDTSRYGHRADVKRASDRLRREADKRACAEAQPERGTATPASAEDDSKKN